MDVYWLTLWIIPLIIFLSLVSNTNKIKKLILILFIPFFSFTQDLYRFEKFKEVTVELPGEVYREVEKSYESLYNDDFEIEIAVIEGESYEYFRDLSEYVEEFREAYKYKKPKGVYKNNNGVFFKKNIREGITSQYSVTFSKEENK